MGLDQYAYVAGRTGQRDEYWNQHDLPEDQRTVTKPREIAYWRKHPNLQGWMERLWEEKKFDNVVTLLEDLKKKRLALKDEISGLLAKA